MQILLNLISIFAFVMSLITWIVSAIHHSIKMKFKIRDFDQPRKTAVQLCLLIQNNSSLPITISGISIIEAGQEYPCRMLSTPIVTDSGVDVVFSTPLPLNLVGRQGTLAFFEFLGYQGTPLALGKKVELRIYTNRASLNRSLTLYQEPGLLRIDSF